MYAYQISTITPLIRHAKHAIPAVHYVLWQCTSTHCVQVVRIQRIYSQQANVMYAYQISTITPLIRHAKHVTRTCATCSGSAPTQCTGCASPQHLLASGVCDLCPVNQYYASSDKTCKPCTLTQYYNSGDDSCKACDTSCATCSGSGTHALCTGCANPTNLLASGKCDVCPSNQYYDSS